MNIKSIQYGDYTAAINLSRGANCISLKNGRYGASILREPDYSKEVDNPYLYGMPVLFPVNRISGGEFTFEGRTYTFPINEPQTGCHLHGELHRCEFELLEITDNKIVCVYRADQARPYLSFPHAFEIRMEYELSEFGLMQTVTVRNDSTENMPCFLGFHTTFNALFAGGVKSEKIKVQVQLSEEYERNMANYLPTGMKLCFDNTTRALLEGSFCPFEKSISRHYRAAPAGKMVLYDEEKDLSVVYENDEQYGFRLIYNGNADGYICLEPQTCLANCANAPFDRDETGFDFMEPRREKQYVSRIHLAEGDKRDRSI